MLLILSSGLPAWCNSSLVALHVVHQPLLTILAEHGRFVFGMNSRIHQPVTYLPSLLGFARLLCLLYCQADAHQESGVGLCLCVPWCRSLIVQRCASTT